MAPEAPAKAASPAAAPRHVARLVRWDVIVTALLITVFAGGALGTPDFATSDNLSFALDDLGEIALIALPMTLLVVAAEVDLSVASVLGMSSALLGALWDAGWAIETIIPLLVVVGAVAGLVNGLLVTRLGLPSLAVTIGTLTLYRGLAYVVLGTKAVARFPQNYADLATHTVPDTPIPYPFALFVVLAVLTAVVLHATGDGPGDLRDRRAGGGRVLRRDPGQAHQAAAVRRLRRGRGLRRRDLHAAVRQRARRQRARARTGRHRGRAARRSRLRRRARHPRRRRRGRPADRPAPQPAHAP